MHYDICREAEAAVEAEKKLKEKKIMKTIWKFKLDPNGEDFVLKMPKGANILTLQRQEGLPVLCALVDPHSEIEERTFVIRGTGHYCDFENYTYIGTFQMLGGVIVLHVFEINESYKPVLLEKWLLKS